MVHNIGKSTICFITGNQFNWIHFVYSSIAKLHLYVEHVLIEKILSYIFLFVIVDLEH